MRQLLRTAVNDSLPVQSKVMRCQILNDFTGLGLGTGHGGSRPDLLDQFLDDRFLLDGCAFGTCIVEQHLVELRTQHPRRSSAPRSRGHIGRRNRTGRLAWPDGETN